MFILLFVLIMIKINLAHIRWIFKDESEKNPVSWVERQNNSRKNGYFMVDYL